LQARTPHRHAFEPPIGPSCREGDIVEVFQRCQPSNYRTNLRRRRPLRRKRSFDLGCRAITAGQRPHGKLQPPIGRRYRFACTSPVHQPLARSLFGLSGLSSLSGFCLDETNQMNQINETNQIN
jgi:hypothetical protein